MVLQPPLVPAPPSKLYVSLWSDRWRGQNVTCGPSHRTVSGNFLSWRLELSLTSDRLSLWSDRLRISRGRDASA
jgi:hypothetical protein